MNDKCKDCEYFEYHKNEVGMCWIHIELKNKMDNCNEFSKKDGIKNSMIRGKLTYGSTAYYLAGIRKRETFEKKTIRLQKWNICLLALLIQYFRK